VGNDRPLRSQGFLRYVEHQKHRYRYTYRNSFVAVYFQL
jgi:hypothetical protein